MRRLALVLATLVLLGSGCPRVPVPPPVPPTAPGKPEEPVPPPIERPPPPESKGTVPEVPPPVRP
jgi:hypothetical protein